MNRRRHTTIYVSFSLPYGYVQAEFTPDEARQQAAYLIAVAEVCERHAAELAQTAPAAAETPAQELLQ